MAAAPPIPYNPVGAQCTLTASDPCLYQVAGYFDNNPQAQLSGCQSLFGFPIVPTVTLSADRVFSTDIATSIYTDIITSTHTLHQTKTETLTYTVTISETDTEYATTVVNTALTTEITTITTRVAAPVTTNPPPAKRLRRRGCGGKPFSSSVATSPESSVTSPSSVSSQVSVSESSFLGPSSVSSQVPISSLSASVSASVSASASSTTASLFPLASACPNEAAYSSACSCLEPPAATQSSDPITSIIRQTDIVTVTETSYTTTVQVTTKTQWADDYATTTATATLFTDTQTTTTVATTTTTTVNPPIPTSFVVRSNESPARNMYFAGNGQIYWALLSELAGQSTPVGLSAPNTQPTNKWSADWKLYLRLSSPTAGEVTMIQANAASGQTPALVPILCSVDDALTFSCQVSNTFSKFMSCGPNLYLTTPNHSPASGCRFIQLNAVE